jgi:carbamoyl-phosphate synthase large subunit
VPSEYVLKVAEGRPNIVDLMIDEKIDLIINTTIGEQTIKDSFVIRRTALDRQIPTRLPFAGRPPWPRPSKPCSKKLHVKSIQSYHKS